MGPQGGRADAVRNHSGVVCNKIKIIKAEWEISIQTEKKNNGNSDSKGKFKLSGL